jgi:hypothetical protein
VIAGLMLKWRRYLNKSFAVFMGLLFFGMDFMNTRFMGSTAHNVAFKSRLFVTLLFVLIAVGGIGMQVWFQRRIVSEFRYDGSMLQFRTIGIAEPQMRPLSHIAAIRDCRVKGATGISFAVPGPAEALSRILGEQFDHACESAPGRPGATLTQNCPRSGARDAYML